MLENINIHSSVAVYQQIENHVQFAIASGELKPGDQLPSVRELSERLDINPNTVAKSYRDLEVLGYVYTRRGMGIYIKKDTLKKCRQTCNEKAIARIHEAVSEAKAAGMKASEIKTIASKSFAYDAGPYGDTPRELLALAKKK